MEGRPDYQKNMIPRRFSQSYTKQTRQMMGATLKNELALQIKEMALLLGYSNCGIIKVSDVADYAQKLEERMSRVRLGLVAYGQFRKFATPQKEHEWAKSIILTVTNNTVYSIPEELKGFYAKSYLVDNRLDELSEGWARRIAFEDFLDSLSIRSFTEPRFGVTALRWAASKAGLGIIRSNNFLYTQDGSEVRVNAWLIDQELELVNSVELNQCPENCGKCIEACPTKALSAPYTTSLVDCVSFLTSLSVDKGMGIPSAKQQEQIGCWIYGCDICQDVCPFNKDKWRGGRDFPGLHEIAEKLLPENIMAMSYSEMADTLGSKFWYISTDKLWKWKINALVSMSNRYEERYKKAIESGLTDEDKRVRKFAKSVCKKLAI